MSKNDQPNAVRLDQWGFDMGRHQRRISMFGIFLIIFGLLLVAGSLFQQAQVGSSALFLALGIVLLLMWVRDRSDAALIVGVVVTGLALSDLLTGLGVVKGNGWGALLVGVGALIVAAIRASSRKSWGWAVVIGGLLCLWGGSEVASAYANYDLGRLVGPILLVILGLWIVSRSRALRF